MNPSFRAGIASGFIAGAALAGLVFLLLRPRTEPEPPRPAPAPRAAAPEDVVQLKEENRRLARKIDELERARPPVPAAAAKEEKPADPAPVDLKGRFAKLAESGLGGMQSPGYGEMLQAVKDAGKAGLEFLMDLLRTSPSATERFLAAALLSGAGDPAGLPALEEALKGDKDLIVRRMAVHAIALMGNSAAEASLRAASTGDSDWGVRVTAAYGLAKLNHEDGLKMLLQAYESSATPPEHRLGILGGLADVAAPSTAPLFRRILADTKDESYLLAAILALEKMKDTESLSALQQIASSSQPDLIKQAAQKAVETIRK